MTTPETRPSNGPAVAAALLIFAVFWALAGVGLGVALWQEAPDTLNGTSINAFAVNTGAVTVIVLCGVGACVCGVGSAVVDQLAKRAG